VIDFWTKPFYLAFILGLFFRKYKNSYDRIQKFVSPQAGQVFFKAIFKF